MVDYSESDNTFPIDCKLPRYGKSRQDNGVFSFSLWSQRRKSDSQYSVINLPSDRESHNTSFYKSYCSSLNYYETLKLINKISSDNAERKREAVRKAYLSRIQQRNALYHHKVINFSQKPTLFSPTKPFAKPSASLSKHYTKLFKILPSVFHQSTNTIGDENISNTSFKINRITPNFNHHKKIIVKKLLPSRNKTLKNSSCYYSRKPTINKRPVSIDAETKYEESSSYFPVHISVHISKKEGS